MCRGNEEERKKKWESVCQAYSPPGRGQPLQSPQEVPCALETLQVLLVGGKYHAILSFKTILGKLHETFYRLIADFAPCFPPILYNVLISSNPDFATLGTSVVVQWLRLHVPSAGGKGSIPGQGIRCIMPHGMAPKTNKFSYSGSLQKLIL